MKEKEKTSSNYAEAVISNTTLKCQHCGYEGTKDSFNKGVILDPFMGSGTTLKVARGTGRNGIGIELNPEYIELAKKRIDIEQGQLF